MAPHGKFVHVRVPKQRTRALETRVLIKSRVLKTRDASFTHTFKTGQLTKLLEILCYLERVSLGLRVSLDTVYFIEIEKLLLKVL